MGVLFIIGIVWLYIWLKYPSVLGPLYRQPVPKREREQEKGEEVKPVCKVIQTPVAKSPVAAKAYVPVPDNEEAEIPQEALEWIYSEPPKWFTGAWGTGEPSYAEQLIIIELDKYRLHWEREVSFEGLLSPAGGYLRYDFYLPFYNTIIEYHGKEWHLSPERIATDNIKTEFCRQHNIKLITYTSKHYHKLNSEIGILMQKLRVYSNEDVPF